MYHDTSFMIYITKVVSCCLDLSHMEMYVVGRNIPNARRNAQFLNCSFFLDSDGTLQKNSFL